MAHLRIEDYAEMKIKAMKLYQKYKKIRYLYWQVMCGYFQAVSQKNNPKINLTIARKVFEKARIPFMLTFTRQRKLYTHSGEVLE